MELRRLVLDGFGRFRGRDIALAPGLNLLFGPNEAGKSTLHAFLDGMLFGFKQTRTRQGRQRRHRGYTPERERYRPWDGGAYAGVLEYEHEGTVYRVARDFERDTLSIRDAATGRDLTPRFDADPVTGERDFARRHAGLTPLIFRHTVSVGQGEAPGDREGFAAEVREALTRSAAPADASGEAALQALTAALDQVGTVARRSSLLGQAAVREAALRDRLAAARAAVDLTRQLEAVQAQRAAAREEEAARRARYEALERAQRAARYRQAAALRAQVAAVEAERDRYAAWASFPAERQPEVDRVQEAVTQRLKALEEAEAERVQQEDAVQRARAAVAALGPLAAFGPEALAEARYAWRSAQQARQRARAARQAAEARRRRLGELEVLDALGGGDPLGVARRLEAEAGAGTAPWWGLGILAAGVLAAVGGLLARSPLAWAGVAAVLAGVVVAAASARRVRRARRAASALAELLGAAGAADVQQLADLVAERRALRDEGDRHEDEAQAWERRAAEEERPALEALAGAGLAPPPAGGDADAHWEGLKGTVAQAQDVLATAAECERELQRRTAAVESARRALDLERARLSDLLRAAGVDGVLAFREAAAAARRYAELQGRWRALQDQLAALLAGADFDALAAQFADGVPEGEAPSEAEVRQAYAAWQAAGAEAAALAEREADLRQQLGPAVAAPAEVEAELRRATAQRVALERRQRALELARAVIVELQQELQRDFAPVLHARLAALAPAFTGGRYADVRVDEDLNVRVRVAGRADLVPVEELSRGTVDQIGLAGRVALAELATGRSSAPLLLDDALTHFDDARLASALAALAELARDRQVLLFTCHGRVVDAARRMGIPHHLVEVGERVRQAAGPAEVREGHGG